MATKSCRLYVGNLPADISESTLREAFEKYGTIENVKITIKPEMAPFAHISFSGNERQIQQGLLKLNNSNFHGSRIRVEEAKESFLDRLKREQENNRKKADVKPDPTTPVTAKSEKKEPEVKVDFEAQSSKKKKKRKQEDSDEDEFRWKIKPFQGTNSNLPEVKTEMKEAEMKNINNNAERKTDKEEIHKKSNDHEDILKTLENFSAAWGDSDSESRKRTNDVEVKVKKVERKDEKKHVDKKLKKETDNQKRIRSLEERNKALVGQKELVKAALVSVDNNVKTKKIIFDEEPEAAVVASMPDKKENALFDGESDESDFEPDFSDKPQFEGEKGKELFDLQSRFSKDNRFKLDQRFAEDKPSTQMSGESEKQRQLKILSEVTGIDVSDDKKRKEALIRKSTFSRYDPTQEKKETPAPKKQKKVEQLKQQQRQPETDHDSPVAENVKVSQERFFETSGSLTELFATKQSFSLLQSFGVAPEPAPEEPVRTTSELVEQSAPAPVEKLALIPPKNLWVEPFFLKHKDERFQAFRSGAAGQIRHLLTKLITAVCGELNPWYPKSTFAEGQDFFFGKVEDPEEYRTRWFDKRGDLVKIYRIQHRRTIQLRALKRKHLGKKKS